MKLPLSIKTKLTVWYLLVIALLLAVFGFTAYFTLARVLYAKILYPWDMHLATVQRSADGSSQITGISGLLPEEINNRRGTIILTRQLSKAEISSGQPLKFSVPAGDLYISPSQIIPDAASTSDELWLRLYVSTADPGHYDLLVIQQSTGDAAIWLATFRKTLLVISIITLAIAGILGFFLVRQMLRPVHKMTRSAEEIEAKNLSLRLAVHSRDEIGRLAGTLNRMLDRLQQAFEREKEFTADASHELRTPLSVIQGEVSLAPYEDMTKDEYQGSLESIGKQASRMATTIEKMMLLSTLEQPQENAFESVKIGALLAGLVEDINVIANPKGIETVLEMSRYIMVDGDPARLRVLFLNLLENAVKYTPQGGTITVGLELCDGLAVVSVADTGIGIAAEHLPRIFQRFYRVDKSRSRAEGGAGLGLAICKRIAELHGGRIEVRSEAGKGSTFTVRLPLKHPVQSPRLAQ